VPAFSGTPINAKTAPSAGLLGTWSGMKAEETVKLRRGVTMTGRKTKRKGKAGIRFNENMNKLGKTIKSRGRTPPPEYTPIPWGPSINLP